MRSIIIGSAAGPLYGDVRGKPYRITFCVADGAVALVQACVETSLEWAIEASLHPHLPVGSRVVQVFAADGMYPAELMDSLLARIALYARASSRAGERRRRREAREAFVVDQHLRPGVLCRFCLLLA